MKTGIQTLRRVCAQTLGSLLYALIKGEQWGIQVVLLDVHYYSDVDTMRTTGVATWILDASGGFSFFFGSPAISKFSSGFGPRGEEAMTILQECVEYKEGSGSFFRIIGETRFGGPPTPEVTSQRPVVVGEA